MPIIPSITYVVDDSGNQAFNTTLEDGITNDTNFDLGGIDGSADANTTVALYFGGQLLGQTTSDANGAWSIPDIGALVAALSGNDTDANNLIDDGSYVFTASSDNVNFSAPFTVTIDTVGPTSVTIDSVTDSQGVVSDTDATTTEDDNTNENDLLIEGTTDVFSNLVAIYDGDPMFVNGVPTGSGVLLGTAVVAANGAWQFQTNDSNNPLSEGNHTFFAVATDGAGNPGPSAQIGPILVDTITPINPPIIVEFTTDSAGGDPTAAVNPEDDTDGITNNNTPTFTGLGEYVVPALGGGATVNLWVTDPTTGVETLYGTDIVDATGAWSITGAAPLADGVDYTFRATQTDASGNESADTTEIVQGLGTADDLSTFTIDTALPGAPIILDYAADTGSSDTDNITRVANGTFNGTAEANSTLTGGTITFTDAVTSVTASTSFSGTIPVDSQGAFTVDLAALGITQPANGAADGVYSITVHTTDAAGNQSPESLPYAVTLDTIHEVGTPDGVADAPTIDNATDNAAADAGAGGTSAGQTQPDNTTASEITISSAGVTNDDTPTLNGTAEAGADVNIFEVNAVTGALDFISSATAYTAANAPAGANAGDWSLTLPTQTPGTHTYVTSAIDIAGNFSSLSVPFTLTVDTAVAAPTIESYTEQTIPNTDVVLDDGITNDRNGIIEGTAEAGSVVNHIEWVNPTGNLIVIEFDYGANEVAITEDGAFIDGSGNPTAGPLPVPLALMTAVQATLTADINGDWALDFSTPGFLALPLTNGDYDIRVSVTDPAGNVSPLSEIFDLEIDTFHDGNNDGDNDNAVDAPVVTFMNANGVDEPTGQNTNDTDLVIKGTAEAGSSVVVTLDPGTGANIVFAAVIADATGNWVLPSTGTLVNDNYAVTVVATDEAGNITSSVANFSFDIGAITATPVITHLDDNFGTVIGDVLSGAPTDDVTPTLEGTAEIGATVTIYDVALNPVATVIAVAPAATPGAIAPALGEWSTPLNPSILPLTHGLHDFTAQATLSNGDLSAISQTFTVNIDVETAPPSISSFSTDTGFDDTDGLTNDDTITLTGDAGTAEPGAIVKIFNFEPGNTTPVAIGTTVAGSDGSWSFTTPTLPNTVYNFTVSQIDVSGTPSSFSAANAADAFTVTVDDVALGIPTITTIGADSGVAGEASTFTDTITNDDTLTIEGTVPGFPITIDVDNPVAGANASVNIYATNPNGDFLDANGLIVLISAPIFTGLPGSVDPTDGTFDVTLGLLPQGEYLFTATSVDAAGNESAPSPTPVPMTIDTDAPDAPDAPNLNTADDSVDLAAAQGSTSSNTDDYTNDNGSDGDFIIDGAVTPGSFVEVLENGVSLGMAVVDGNGNWTFDVTTSDLVSLPVGNPTYLADGDYSFTILATDPAGNTSAPSAPLLVKVDTGTPIPTVVVNADTSNAILDALDASVNNNSIADTETDGITKQDSNLTLSGVAEAGSTITITNNFGVNFTFIIGGANQNNQVLADPITGAWEIDIPNPITGAFFDNDVMNFTIAAVDIAGNPSISYQTVTIDTNVPVATINALNAISDTGTLGDGITAANVLTLTGTVSSDNTSNETVEIFNNGVSIGVALVDANDQWVFTTGTLANDTYSFTAVPTDGAGNEGTDSAPLNIQVDAAGDAPVITGISNDTGTPDDGITSDATPEIAGTADANAAVTVYQDGAVIGNVTADGAGAWVFPIIAALAEGSYVFTASSIDPATNTSVQSEAFDVTIDLSTPQPLISLIADDSGAAAGGSTFDNDLDLTGTAEAGASIQLLVNNQPVGAPVIADGQGNWTLATGPLAAGFVQLTVEATDEHGHQATSNPSVVTIVPNEAPVFTSPVAFSMDENTTEVGTVAASDADGDTVTYAITGGADAALFTVSAAGVVSFLVAPDFEAFASAAGTNVYDVIVSADDSNGGITPQTLAVTVEDIINTVSQVGTPDVDNIVGTEEADSIFALASGDTINALGGNDNISAGSGDDVVYGGAGNDVIYGEHGADQLHGDAGVDVLYVDAADTVVSGGADEDYLIVSDAAGGSWSASDIENWVGASGADTMNATGATSLVYMQGHDGDDTLTGGTAGDWLYGNAGVDTINGGAGDDTLFGGVGADIMNGGIGNDVLYVDSLDTVYDGGAGNDYALVTDAAGVNLDLTANNIENAIGFTGADILDARGSTEAVDLKGGDGGDMLYAGTAGSILEGQGGNDMIYTGTGVDHVVGGAGADTVFVETGNGIDYMYDFVQGEDTINLSGTDVVDFVSLTIDETYSASGWHGIDTGAGDVLWVNDEGTNITFTADDFDF